MRTAYRPPWIELATLSATLIIPAGCCRAAEAVDQANINRQEVLVHANRYVEDQQVTEHVRNALTDDPWIYPEHVTVTTHNGVVTLEGIVSDLAELRRIIRLCRKIPGARHVYTSGIEINAQLPDSG